MRRWAHYLRFLDEISHEDFPALRKLLLDKGISKYALRKLPTNLMNHELCRSFQRYCVYVEKEEQDLLATAQEQAKIEQIRIKEEKNRQALLKQKEKEENILKHQALVEKQRLASLDKKLKKEENERKMAELSAIKQEKKLLHEKMMEQHRLEKQQLEQSGKVKFYRQLEQWLESINYKTEIAEFYIEPNQKKTALCILTDREFKGEKLAAISKQGIKFIYEPFGDKLEESNEVLSKYKLERVELDSKIQAWYVGLSDLYNNKELVVI